MKKISKKKPDSNPILKPEKIRDDAYQVTFNSKLGVNVGQPSLYSQSSVISSVTSTTVFVYTAFPSTNYYYPSVVISGVIFCTPTTNTISNLVNISNLSPSTRTATIALAPTPAYDTTSRAVFVNRNNPPTAINMCLSATTNSSTIPFIATTMVSTISVGDSVQFGNDTTTILPAVVTAIAGDLLSITIDGTRSIPINTIITIYKTTNLPVMVFRNNLNYQMDWSLLEKGKYKGSFSMEIFSPNWAGSNLAIPIQVYLNMGVNTNTLEAGNPNFSNNLGGIASSSFIGVVNASQLSAYFLTNNNQNSPFYMRQTPKSNIVNIQLVGNAITLFNGNILTNKVLWTDSAGCGDYMLTLLLERLTEEDLPFYNIIFNSRFSSGATATLANTFTQSINWSVLPQGRYKCSYYVLGLSNTSTALTNITSGTTMVNMLYSNIPISNTIESGNEDGTNRFSNQFCMGLFSNYNFGLSFWTTLFSQNFPFVISRPENNNVTFRILTNMDRTLNVLTGTIFPHSLICLRMELLPEK